MQTFDSSEAFLALGEARDHFIMMECVESLHHMPDVSLAAYATNKHIQGFLLSSFRCLEFVSTHPSNRNYLIPSPYQQVPVTY